MSKRNEPTFVKDSETSFEVSASLTQLPDSIYRYTITCTLPMILWEWYIPTADGRNIIAENTSNPLQFTIDLDSKVYDAQAQYIQAMVQVEGKIVLTPACSFNGLLGPFAFTVDYTKDFKTCQRTFNCHTNRSTQITTTLDGYPYSLGTYDTAASSSFIVNENYITPGTHNISIKGTSNGVIIEHDYTFVSQTIFSPSVTCVFDISTLIYTFICNTNRYNNQTSVRSLINSSPYPNGTKTILNDSTTFTLDEKLYTNTNTFDIYMSAGIGLEYVDQHFSLGFSGGPYLVTTTHAFNQETSIHTINIHTTRPGQTQIIVYTDSKTSANLLFSGIVSDTDTVITFNESTYSQEQHKVYIETCFTYNSVNTNPYIQCVNYSDLSYPTYFGAVTTKSYDFTGGGLEVTITDNFDETSLTHNYSITATRPITVSATIDGIDFYIPKPVNLTSITFNEKSYSIGHHTLTITCIQTGTTHTASKSFDFQGGDLIFTVVDSFDPINTLHTITCKSTRDDLNVISVFTQESYNQYITPTEEAHGSYNGELSYVVLPIAQNLTFGYEYIFTVNERNYHGTYNRIYSSSAQV